MSTKIDSYKVKIDVCKTLMPPPQHIENSLDHCLDLSPTDLNIEKSRLLINDYLPTKFDTSGAKRS